MAETQTPSKRQREETLIEDVEETKRHKSYNHILSLLESEEEEATQDLSSLITTLQQELSSESVVDPLPSQTNNDHESNPTSASTTTPDNSNAATSSPSATSSCSKDEEDDRQRVIRHLLEASDDELGIPNMEASADNGGYGELDFNGGDGFAFCDGLWELEDEAANYYTLLQSELFM